MADAETLSFAFMRTHPAQAAEVLEALPAQDAAALFARAPARVGAPVLSAMLPAPAARALGALEAERAVELLSALGARQAAALQRRTPEPRRSHLLGALPAGMALASRVLLGYPDDTVGAWANPDVIALPPSMQAAQALERVRRSDTTAERVYVVGPEQRLLGSVSVGTLLRAGEHAALDTLAHAPRAVLAARTPLAGAAAHPGWQHDSVLPVVEARERLLGALTREALARALRGAAARARAPAEETLGGLVARGYWEALSGLVLSAATLLPSVRPVAGRGDED
jgi:Mg/Co/Ni transporter MgtE